MFHTEKDPNPRIEWKKKGKDVSFVYFDGHFRGEMSRPRFRTAPAPVGRQSTKLQLAGFATRNEREHHWDIVVRQT